MKKNLLFLFSLLTVNLFFAQVNCYQQDNGRYQYYAKLVNIPNLNSNFDKNEFINYVTAYGNLTNENLTVLNSDVISVIKSFPASQTPFLQNVVSIDSVSDIYPIISNANHSISTIECRNNPILLGTQNTSLHKINLSVTKNPIDETSQLKIDSHLKIFELCIANAAGQIIYKNKFRNTEVIYLNDLIKEKGIFIVTVINIENSKASSVKIIKQRQ